MAHLLAYGAAQRQEWPLDPAIAYLNHGGYGVTPHVVLEEQELSAPLREAATVLAEFMGARGDDVVFVDNATTGCNAVLRSLELKPGDEILITDLAYGAIAKAARYVARRTGATVIEAHIPLPLRHDDAVVAAVADRLGPRTRLAVFDHVASHSALVLPVRELTRLAHAAGARVLVDGAHAPGQLPVDLPSLGPDWYVGNCHKWLLAPRGCGFLWAEPPQQALVHPLAISHGYGSGFLAEFDWTGTRDPSPFLSLPAAIACHRRLGGEALMARNAALARQAARRLVERWRTELGGPEDSFAAMVTVRLPIDGAATPERSAALQRRLSDEHRIAVAIMAQAGALWARIAAQAYNEPADYERLAALW